MAGSMITFESKGSWQNTDRWLRRLSRLDLVKVLNEYGEKGVRALQAATPVESGETARSWKYTIFQKGKSSGIVFSNTHIEKGANVAILIQYGHATGTGGFVQGRDFINPAIQPIFDEIANSAWKEVTRL